MAIRKYKNFIPQIAETAWVDPSAQVIGQVELAADVNIWPTAVLRGDINTITVGERTSIQDGVIIHCTHESQWSTEAKTIIGKDVTVGHGAILHGCIIEDESLIGMGATVLDGAVIKKHVLVGANSLVPPNKVLESGYLYVGSPVRRARALTQEEKDFFKYSAAHYVKLKNDFAAEEPI